MKTVKRIFLYSVLTIFEGFDTKLVSISDAMTDEKLGVIFADFGPIYIAIYGHNDFTIWPYGHYIKFASDATHLIRVEGNKPFSLIYRDKLNGLTFANRAEAESVIQAIVKGEEINLRYYEDKGNRYNQVDSKLQNIFLGFVYCKAANLFGWKDLGISPELPPVKLNTYTPTSPDSKAEVQVNIQGNPALMLTKRKGSSCASIRVGGIEVLRLNSNGEYVYIDNFMSDYLVIRDSNGIIVFKERLPIGNYIEKPTNYTMLAFGDTRWPEGETAVKKAWESAPLGRIELEAGWSIDSRDASLYGFRELWKWGVDNLNFPSLDDVEDHKEEVEAKDTGKNFKITDYQAQVKILENGDIHVNEIFTYDFNGNFNGIIRSIGTGGSDGLVNFRASEYSPQRKVLETSQSLEGEMVTFRIYDQSSNERKSFLLEYQLKNVITKYNDIAEFYWKFFDQANTSPIESIKVEVEFFNEISKVVYEVGRLSPGEKLGMKILFTNDSSSQISETTYSLTGSLHCPDKRGYPCNSCSSAKGYINHFKGFNVLTTNEDCYVKLIYNNGDYIGNYNNCEVTIKGEKWLGLENESGTELVEEINKGNFDFTRANKFIERTMNFPEDGYNYEFANNGKEFRLYLSRNREEAF